MTLLIRDSMVQRDIQCITALEMTLQLTVNNTKNGNRDFVYDTNDHTA